jgi:hypothetical protein
MEADRRDLTATHEDIHRKKITPNKLPDFLDKVPVYQRLHLQISVCVLALSWRYFWRHLGVIFLFSGVIFSFPRVFVLIYYCQRRTRRPEETPLAIFQGQTFFICLLLTIANLALLAGCATMIECLPKISCNCMPRRIGFVSHCFVMFRNSRSFRRTVDV